MIKVLVQKLIYDYQLLLVGCVGIEEVTFACLIRIHTFLLLLFLLLVAALTLLLSLSRLLLISVLLEHILLGEVPAEINTLVIKHLHRFLFVLSISLIP